MIFPGPLTDEQKQRSQFNYNMFNLVNGFSYMCLGETVLILLAVRLACPDYLVSALGAMIFFGFLLLPLGKIMTARVGAARCQALFWIFRNIAAMMVASASVLCYFNLRILGMICLMVGAFFFYGFRAAGVVMSQPLVGDITDDSSRARLLSVSIGIFYFSSLIALVTISILTSISSSIWMLTGIVIVGAIFGFTSSGFIAKIDETEGLRKSAAKPILQDLRPSMKDRTFRRLLAGEFMMNLGVIMILPVSVLTMKRGYGISDTQALLYSLVQFAASTVMSWMTMKTLETIGARRTMLLTYLGLLLCGLLWLISPASLTWWFSGFLFFLMGTAYAYVNSAMPCYFLQSIPQEKRVSASVFIAIFTGAGAGVVGMFLSGALLNLSKLFTDNEYQSYQWYFLLATLVLLPGIWIMCRLTRLPKETSSFFHGHKHLPRTTKV